jgi:hypothetical protein
MAAPFREANHLHSGYALPLRRAARGVAQEFVSQPYGKAQPFRTSGGRAANLELLILSRFKVANCDLEARHFKSSGFEVANCDLKDYEVITNCDHLRSPL